MARWQQAIAQVTNDVQGHFEHLKQRLIRQLGDDPIHIMAYHGYGTQKRLFLKGRVLEDEGVGPSQHNDSIWENIVNMYRRFESDEIPNARILVRF